MSATTGDRVNLADEAYDLLIALETIRDRDDFAYSPACDIAPLANLPTDRASGYLRWMERAGLVQRDSFYNGRSWWGLSPYGEEVLKASQ